MEVVVVVVSVVLDCFVGVVVFSEAVVFLTAEVSAEEDQNIWKHIFKCCLQQIFSWIIQRFSTGVRICTQVMLLSDFYLLRPYKSCPSGSLSLRNNISGGLSGCCRTGMVRKLNTNHILENLQESEP